VCFFVKERENVVSIWFSTGHCTDCTVDCIVYSESVSVTDMHVVESMLYMIKSVVLWYSGNTLYD